MRSKTLSLVVPVFNEAAAIRPFLEKVAPFVSAALEEMEDGAKPEFLFVNDGSVDGTDVVVAAVCEADPNVKLINFSRNFGKEAALAAGLDHASGDAVIPIDVDLQDDPSIIPDMVRAWLAGADVVNAKRVDRSSDGWVKRSLATAFYRVFNLISSNKMPENIGDFRLLSRRAVDVIRKLPERTRMNKALFNWIGFKTATIDYVRAERLVGASKWPTWRLWNFALDGITSSTTAPLRVWTYVGASIALFAFAYALFLIARIAIFGVDVPGYASIMVTVLLLSGLQLLSLGVLGEYIGRIATEVRGRPLYVVESVVGL